MAIKNSIYIGLICLFITACNDMNIRSALDSGNDYESIHKRANSAYLRQEWVNAERDYQTLAKQRPGELETWYRLGNIYANTDNLDAAVRAYRKALDIDAKNSKVWNNLGVVQLRQATRTFVEMYQNADSSDPLKERAEYVVDNMSKLMKTAFNASVSD